MIKKLLKRFNIYIIRKNISKVYYYKLMEDMHNYKDFETLHENWRKCFEYILKSFNCGFTSEAIDNLFYNFNMLNWKELWIENSEYKNYSKEKLIESFTLECFYISDRTSFDRLFRTHWLFRKAFYEELENIKINLL